MQLALVTGCGSPRGIGFATALKLGLSGLRLAIVSTSPRIHDRVKELREAGCGECEGYVADLTRPEEVAALISGLGPLSVVVNNAGMAVHDSLPESSLLENTTLAQWNDTIARNLTTAMLVTRACLPLLSCRGRIVFVSSTTGALCGVAGDAAYAAAKAGLVGLARSLSLEVARKGITVNCVLPGWIDTGSATDEEREAGRATPLGRSGSAAEVAAAIAFLASEGASYITGQTLVIDGGNSVVEKRGQGAFDA